MLQQFKLKSDGTAQSVSLLVYGIDEAFEFLTAVFFSGGNSV
jgi:hypothetical protein